MSPHLFILKIESKDNISTIFLQIHFIMLLKLPRRPKFHSNKWLMVSFLFCNFFSAPFSFIREGGWG
jgi:hypothetical protein